MTNGFVSEEGERLRTRVEEDNTIRSHAADRSASHTGLARVIGEASIAIVRMPAMPRQ